MIVQIIVQKPACNFYYQNHCVIKLKSHENKGNDISYLNTVKNTDKKRRFDRSSVIFK